MKVFVGGMHHESDTFNPITTSKDDIWVIEKENLWQLKDRSSAKGIIDTLNKRGFEIAMGIFAGAVPNGEWDKTCYLELEARLLKALKEALPVDAVCLALHGSMRAKGIGPVEGRILEKIRSLCPDALIVASLDMHATVTEKMMKNANAFVGYKTAPHVDTYETGAHAACITAKALEEGFVPKMAGIRLPFLIAGEQSETSVQPMKDLICLLRSYEKKPGILASSYLLGFPWADTQENGVCALAVSRVCQEEADKAAMELARVFWEKRDEFKFYNETADPKDAIDRACKSIEKGIWPVVLSDSGDNPTAGSSQDVTSFLKLIIKDKRLASLNPPLCYQGFYDPDFCKKAFEAGKGSILKAFLGANFDTKTSSPLKVEGTVKALVKNWGPGKGTDLVLVDIGGIEVVVTSRHTGCYDPQMMRALGVEPSKRECIVVKLGYLEPEIRAIAKRSIMVLTRGSTDELFQRLSYKHIKRPIFPLDPQTQCSFEFIGR